MTATSVEGASATLPLTDSPARKAWDKLSRWIACVCVVTFDLELGQAIEVRHQAMHHYPPVVLAIDCNYFSFYESVIATA